MVTVGILLIFVKQYIVKTLGGPTNIAWDETADSDDMEDDEEEAKDALSVNIFGAGINDINVFS